MATVKTIPQNINLIGRLTKNNKSAARAARTLEHLFPMPVPSLGRADTSWRLVSLHLIEFSLGHTCIFHVFFFPSESLYLRQGPKHSQFILARSIKLYLHHWVIVLQKLVII